MFSARASPPQDLFVLLWAIGRQMMRCPGPRPLQTSWRRQPAPFTSISRISTNSVTTRSGRRRRPRHARGRGRRAGMGLVSLTLAFPHTPSAPTPVGFPQPRPPPLSPAWRSTPALPMGSYECGSYLPLLRIYSMLRLSVSPEEVFILSCLTRMRSHSSIPERPATICPSSCFKPGASSF